MSDILEKRAKYAAETILENESLTGDLDDGAAQVLLDWGLACAKMIAQSTEGLGDAEAEEMMSNRLRAVRRLMRPMDEWINRQEADPERSAALLAKIVEQAKIVYGEDYVPPAESQQERFLAQYQASDKSPEQVITDLRQFLENTNPVVEESSQSPAASEPPKELHPQPDIPATRSVPPAHHDAPINDSGEADGQEENFFQQLISDVRQFLGLTNTSTLNDSGEENDQEKQQEI